MATTLLSLDPSSTSTGWALWDGDKLGLHAKIYPKGDVVARIAIMCDYIADIMSGKEAPQSAVIEWPSRVPFGRAAKNLSNYHIAAGAIVSVCWQCLGPEAVYGVYPQTWKGSVKKNVTIKLINELYGLDLTLSDDDIADAIGIGTWFVKRQDYNPLKPLVDSGVA